MGYLLCHKVVALEVMLACRTVEVRKYPPHLVAEVEFPPDTPDMKTALSGGFRSIAR